MKPLIDDDFWAIVQPLLPPPKPRRFDHPGRLPVGDREVLTGIAFVLKTGIGWDDLPAELGWGCGKTCRQRLRTWRRLGIWDRIRAAILARLNRAGEIDWRRGSIDSGSVRSPGGGAMTGPNPTDRRKLGSKHHILVDGRGIPLAVMTTGANRHDSQAFIPLLDALVGVGGKPAAGDDSRTKSWATGRTTRRRCGGPAGTAESDRDGPSGTRPTAADSGYSAGRSNGPSVGYTASAGSATDGTGCFRFTKRF